MFWGGQKTFEGVGNFHSQQRAMLPWGLLEVSHLKINTDHFTYFKADTGVASPEK